MSSGKEPSQFNDLASAFKWARDNFPNCSFSVREQVDGPTIVSVKGKDPAIRTVVYVRKGESEHGRKPNV